jgi:hypothetical protein
MAVPDPHPHPQPTLHRAVVLVFLREHGGVAEHEHVGGLIVNKPTDWTLDCLVEDAADRQVRTTSDPPPLEQGVYCIKYCCGRCFWWTSCQ